MKPIRTLLLGFAFSPLAYGQSFDCKLARSPREHAVCSDSLLATLDSAVSKAYKSLRAQLSPESAALVQSDQREWLHLLDIGCFTQGKGIAMDNRCLEDSYGAREHDLKQTIHIGNKLIFLRSHSLYRPRSPTEDHTANDPGFGGGTLKWPQIDIQSAMPGNAYVSLNSKIKKEAAKLAIGFDAGDKQATFDSAVDAGGEIYGYYFVEAADDRFIDISFIDMAYGYGAAHPVTSQTSFLWWVDRNRELTIPDVFTSNSGWQEKLTALVIKGLRSQPDLQEFLNENFEKTVSQTVSDTTAWTISRNGLTIRFGQYTIAAYAADMPEVQIPWNDIKSYIAPDFEYLSLPTAIPHTNR